MAKDNKKLDKYKHEEKWASILLRHLNDVNESDYIIIEPNTPSGWGDVDVCARSTSGTRPPLYIQLCLDVKPGSAGYERIMEYPKTYTFNNCGNVLGAIEGKIKKYTEQRKDFSGITLAVQSIGSWFIEGDEKYIIEPLKKECEELKKKYKDIGFFKAIYLLSQGGEISDGQTMQKNPERVFRIL